MAQSSMELFNGKNLKGWNSYEPSSGIHKKALDLFNVSDGMIRLYGDRTGYLITKKSFKDFKLTVEFRWNTNTNFKRKTDQKNGGVMYNIPPESPDMLWPKGIQFQIKEGATGDFILLHDVTLKINGHRNEAGESVVSKRFEDATNPIGEWNTIVITCINGTVKQELNGKLVNMGTEASVLEGRILLQYEGYPIDFRKVEIEKL